MLFPVGPIGRSGDRAGRGRPYGRTYRRDHGRRRNRGSSAGDISIRKDVEALFTEAAEGFGEVGVLVNKAVIALIKPLARVREGDIDRMLTVNGKGTMSAASSRPRGFPGRQEVINLFSATAGLMLRGLWAARELRRMSAFGRLGRVEDIADVVVFLASDQARWITGQVIRVNGGRV